MSNNINKLQRRIMRRVYYSFGIKQATSPLAVHGVLLLVAVYGLSVMVHVASIFNNLRGVELSRLDNFVFNAFMHAEFWTLVFVGIICFTMLSLNWSLKAPQFARQRLQTMQ